MELTEYANDLTKDEKEMFLHYLAGWMEGIVEGETGEFIVDVSDIEVGFIHARQHAKEIHKED